MPRTRQTGITVRRLAALWLLALSVVLGPVGFGGSVAAAAACLCDEQGDEQGDDVQAEHRDGDDACEHEADESSEHAPSQPEPAEDDCSECGCCPGVATAVLQVVVPVLLERERPLAAFEPADAPALGDRSGVFRPPRSDMRSC